jgi:hypothetical protein
VGALGLLWLIGQWRGWRWSASAGLISLTGLAAWGVWSQLPAPWLLFGLVAALAAWDLARFSQRLQQARQVIDEASLIWAHLQRLLIIAGLGLLLGEIALAVRLEFNLGWALLLGLLLILGLSQVTNLIRRQQS